MIRTTLTFDSIVVTWPTSHEIDPRDEMKWIQTRFEPLVSFYVQKIIIILKKWSMIRTNLTFDSIVVTWPTSHEIDPRDEMKWIQTRFDPLVSFYVQKIIIILKKWSMIRTTLTFDSIVVTWPTSHEIDPRD
jgi:hypothetical protein